MRRSYQLGFSRFFAVFLFIFAVQASAQLPPDVETLPPYFMVPRIKWASLSGVGIPSSTRDYVHSKLPSVGLRFFPFSNTDRVDAAEKLAQLGLVQDGDILLAFRPEWAHTVAYANIQLGVPHSALAILKNGRVHSVEVPLSYSSPMNEKSHWMGLRGVHILRTQLTPEQRANVRAWLEKLLVRGPAHISFKTDYLDPYYAQTRNYQFVNRLAGLALGANIDLDMYCSEFVFAALSLRNCDPARFVYDKTKINECIQPIFEPVSGVGSFDQPGLAEGPSTLLRVAGMGDDNWRRAYLLNSVLIDEGDPTSMSQYHRELAKMFRPLVGALQKYYGSGESAQIAAGINAQLKPNYSPALLLVKAIQNDNIFDYVGTVYFHD